LEILKENWTKNKNLNSLYNYCLLSNIRQKDKIDLLEPVCLNHRDMLIYVLDFTVKSHFYTGYTSFAKQNYEIYHEVLWNDFRCLKRISIYGSFLANSFHKPIQEKGLNILKISYKETKDPLSLHNIGKCLERMGRKKEAKDVYLKNWTENKYKESLEYYTWFLRLGKGGQINIALAEKLDIENNIVRL